jgi:DNA-binding MarR family transcriptional regulator
MRDEAAAGLMRTADLLRRSISRVLEPHEVTAQQYNVLRILRGAGEKGLPTLDIADRMIEQAPGITRLIDRLEAKGLVRRERCREDRRQVLCWLTPEGLALIERLDEPVNQADATAMSRLSAEELEQLIRLLDKVRSGLVP